ncbi:MAG: DUF2283 domain-containing protein, partial [Rhodomicrobium sp.]
MVEICINDLTEPDHEIIESEVADGIVVDYDAEGQIVGVEIHDASRRRSFRFEAIQLRLAACTQPKRSSIRISKPGGSRRRVL